MNFLRKAERFFDRLMNLMLLVSGVIVILDTVLVAQDVIVRKSLDYTWSPLYEILTYSLVWMTFLGTAAIYRDDGHVKLDSFMQLLPKRTQTFINFLTSCAVVVLCIFMCFLTARLTINDALNHFVLATILNPPKWPIEIIIPIAFFMLFIQAIRHSVRYFKAYRYGEPTKPTE
jgi:TRAP-type C4-dicarboxylate transport system permease small subunit